MKLLQLFLICLFFVSIAKCYQSTYQLSLSEPFEEEQLEKDEQLNPQSQQADLNSPSVSSSEEVPESDDASSQESQPEASALTQDNIVQAQDYLQKLITDFRNYQSQVHQLSTENFQNCTKTVQEMQCFNLNQWNYLINDLQTHLDQAQNVGIPYVQQKLDEKQQKLTDLQAQYEAKNNTYYIIGENLQLNLKRLEKAQQIVKETYSLSQDNTQNSASNSFLQVRSKSADDSVPQITASQSTFSSTQKIQAETVQNVIQSAIFKVQEAQQRLEQTKEIFFQQNALEQQQMSDDIQNLEGQIAQLNQSVLNQQQDIADYQQKIDQCQNQPANISSDCQPIMQQSFQEMDSQNAYIQKIQNIYNLLYSLDYNFNNEQKQQENQQPPQDNQATAQENTTPHPPQENQSSSQDNQQPPTDSQQPQTEKKQTSADNIQPLADNTKPSADNSQPSANTIQPLAGNTQTSADNTQPPADNTQPSADNTQSPADNTQPPADNTQPPADNTQPPTDNKPLNNNSQSPAPADNQPITQGSQQSLMQDNQAQSSQQIEETSSLNMPEINLSNLLNDDEIVIEQQETAQDAEEQRIFIEKQKQQLQQQQQQSLEQTQQQNTNLIQVEDPEKNQEQSKQNAENEEESDDFISQLQVIFEAEKKDKENKNKN